MKMTNNVNVYDLDLLARLITAEARGEPYEGMLAVGTVVLNRVDSPLYSDIIKEIILQRYQFATPSETATDECIKAATEVLNGYRHFNNNVLMFQRKKQADWYGYKWLCTIGAHNFYYKPVKEGENKAMQPINKFIEYLLPHSLNAPQGKYLIPLNQVASKSRGYLLGTDGLMCTQKLIDSKESLYINNGWTKTKYQATAKKWLGMEVTDCQGEADGYALRIMGKNIATNAVGNYTNWCTTKGADMGNMPLDLGVAVFMTGTNNKDSSIHHVGWICGYTSDDKPLVWESRGLEYGCQINELSKRPWNRWGLMDKYFEYEKTPTAELPRQLTVNTKIGSLKLRSNKVNGLVLTEMPKGAKLWAQTIQNDWAKCVYYDENKAQYYEGWASLSYLK